MRTNWIIWAVVCLHFLMGLMLWSFPQTAPVAYLIGLHYLIRTLPYPAASILLIMGSVSMVPALVLPIGRWSRALAIPQYIIVIVSFSSIALTILTGSIISGTPVPREFLAVGALPLLCLAVWHTVSIIHYVRLNKW